MNDDKKFPEKQRFFLITLNNPFYYNTDISDEIEQYLVENIDLTSSCNKVGSDFDAFLIDNDFCHNKYPYHNLTELIDYAFNFDYVRGVVGQLEKGGDCHTVHAHLYLELNKPKRWADIKKIFPSANIVDGLRDRDACINYVQKEDTRIENPISKGEFSTQGKRTDLEKYKTAIINGASDFELVEDFSQEDSKFHKWGEHVRLVAQKEKVSSGNRELKVYYVYSKCDTDLVEFVKGLESDLYVVNDYDCMFQTYENEKAVLLDDFVVSLDLQKLLPLLKKSTTTLNVKYSVKIATYTSIYICSCISWEEQLQLYTFDKRPELLVRLKGLVNQVINVDTLERYSGNLEKVSSKDNINVDEIF